MKIKNDANKDAVIKLTAEYMLAAVAQKTKSRNGL